MSQDKPTLADKIADHMSGLEEDHGKLKHIHLEWEDGFVMDINVNLTKEETMAKFVSTFEDTDKVKK